MDGCGSRQLEREDGFKGNKNNTRGTRQDKLAARKARSRRNLAKPSGPRAARTTSWTDPSRPGCATAEILIGGDIQAASGQPKTRMRARERGDNAARHGRIRKGCWHEVVLHLALHPLLAGGGTELSIRLC